MNMKRKRVGVDLDDVLLDLNTALAAFTNRAYGTSLRREDIHTFNLHEVWGCTRQEARRRIAEFYDSPEHALMIPIDGAQEALEMIASFADTFIITARPEWTRGGTEELLTRHYPSLVSAVTYTNHGTKAEVCRTLGVHVFVDDAPHNVDEVAPVVETALLFDAPWNRGYTPAHANLRRVHSWIQALELIEQRR